MFLAAIILKINHFINQCIESMVKELAKLCNGDFQTLNYLIFSEDVTQNT